MSAKPKQRAAALFAAAAFQAAFAGDISDRAFFKDFQHEIIALRQNLPIKEAIGNGAQLEIKDVRQRGGFLVFDVLLENYRSALPFGDRYTRQDLHDMFRASANYSFCLKINESREINRHIGLRGRYALPEWHTTVSITLPKGHCARLLAEKTPQQIEADSARTVLAVVYRETNKQLPVPHSDGLEIYRIELKDDVLHRYFRLLPTADTARSPQQWQDTMRQKIRRDICRAGKGKRELAQINSYFSAVDHLALPNERESIDVGLPQKACSDGVIGGGEGNDHYGKAAKQP